MKIKLSKIKFSKYDPREEIDEDYINELAKSIEQDGLWNPILVKNLSNGEYVLISGGHRLRAVQKIGWDEIEAKLLDVEDVQLLESSGYALLDREAIESVWKGATYGPLPKAYPNDNLKIMAFFLYDLLFSLDHHVEFL